MRRDRKLVGNRGELLLSVVLGASHSPLHIISPVQHEKLSNFVLDCRPEARTRRLERFCFCIYNESRQAVPHRRQHVNFGLEIYSATSVL